MSCFELEKEKYIRCEDANKKKEILNEEDKNCGKIVGMEEYKNKTVQFLDQCRKKEYISNYSNYINSCPYKRCRNNGPNLKELANIIRNIITKDEEEQLCIMINCLEFCRGKETFLWKQKLFNITSKTIVNAVYDFCKSVMDDYVDTFPERKSLCKS